MNLIFFGTSEFAVPALEALVTAGFKPIAVVTLPDRPHGRGLAVLPSPVKTIAEKHRIPVWQPEKLSDPEFLRSYSETERDIGVVAAYGKLIPQNVIDIPKKGFLNIHPSLLPELRGPSPIQYAILEGKQTTGVTIMLVDAEMDHGPILLQEEDSVDPSDTMLSLSGRLAQKGAELLVKALPQWLDGTLVPKEQDHSKATFSKKIEKENGHIRWTEPARAIDRAIRAFRPWPGTFAFAMHNGKKLRVNICEAAPFEHAPVKNPGLVERTEDGMIVWCADGYLCIARIQPEGKRAMAGEDFLRGYAAIIGSLLT